MSKTRWRDAAFAAADRPVNGAKSIILAPLIEFAPCESVGAGKSRIATLLWVAPAPKLGCNFPRNPHSCLCALAARGAAARMTVCCGGRGRDARLSMRLCFGFAVKASRASWNRPNNP